MAAWATLEEIALAISRWQYQKKTPVREMKGPKFWLASPGAASGKRFPKYNTTSTKYITMDI
jgi:hypothetical protein